MKSPTSTRHRSRHSTALTLLAALGLLAAACTGGDDPVDEGTATTVADEDGADDESDVDVDPAPEFPDALTVVVANSPGTVSLGGAQRILTALIGSGPNDFVGSDQQPVQIMFRPAAGEDDDAERIDGAWLTTDAAPLGLYVSYFDFPSAGTWEVRVEADGRDLGGTLVEVVEQSSVPNIGDPAPRSDSPVSVDGAGLASISTDPEPDPELYDLSIADAVGNGRPTLIAFATPAFCQTALCGPTLETVKAAAAGRADLDVVHVEPFDLELAPAGELVPIQAMFDWGLVTEPWVFVVDADGAVAASFEGIIGQEELDAALDRL